MKTPDINQILRTAPVSSRYGAPMGAVSHFDNPETPLYVQRIRFIDGDYASDGTYWGGQPSEPLYCGFSVDGANRIYMRATSRAQAMQKIAIDYPSARFHKKP